MDKEERKTIRMYNKIARLAGEGLFKTESTIESSRFYYYSENNIQPENSYKNYTTNRLFKCLKTISNHSLNHNQILSDSIKELIQTKDEANIIIAANLLYANLK